MLACTASLAAGVNVLPWTGPTLRAAAALKVPVSALFTPMIGVQAVGLGYVFAVSWWLGRREGRRLATRPAAGDVRGRSVSSDAHPGMEDDVASLRRPRLLWVNALLTLAVVGLMVSGVIEPVAVFMVGTALALLINYPDAAGQRARIDAHARAALLMASILLAAGAFTGIMTGSGMIGAMAEAVARNIPGAVGERLPVLMGTFAMPLSLRVRSRLLLFRCLCR